MIKPDDPRQLVEDTLIERSVCRVQVGAAIADHNGRILSWGWNHVGDGYGCHAEFHAIRRSNKSRLSGATIFVGSLRRRNRKVVPSKPCSDCARVIAAYNLKVVWRDKDGKWIYE
jgi:deoxycytidylate deaminase